MPDIPLSYEELEDKLIRLERENRELKNSILHLSGSSYDMLEDHRELQITDLIELDKLQQLQDAFTKATGVASVITDCEGNPITQPGNFSGVCQLIRQTPIGFFNCRKSDKTIGSKAALLGKPTFEKCHSCGFIDAGAPIIVGNQQIALWMIGQSNVGNVDENRIIQYSDEIGADRQKMIEEYKKMSNMSLEQFDHVTNLLWLFAKELSDTAYKNLLLAKRLEEQAAFEKTIKLAKEKAEESDRLKTAFLKNISHEIRTPLNGILGFTELLASPDIEESEKQCYLKIIHTSSNQLNDIIQDIVDMATIESHQESMNKTTISVQSLFDELYTVFFNTAKIKHLKFSFHIGHQTDQDLIYIDKTKLTQIFNNLLSNAFKYTQKGMVSFGSYTDDASFVFYVKDTGSGIEKKYQKKIFKRFWRIMDDSNMNKGGTGLGLSIVKGYVKLLKGRLWLISEKDKGSEFYFSIPFERIANKPNSTAKSENIISISDLLQ